MGCHGVAQRLFQITWIVFAQLMICLDQPNRRMRTRTSGGVGGGLRKGAPYPVIGFYLFFFADDLGFRPVNQAQRCIRLCIQPGRIGGRLGSLNETSHPFYRQNDKQHEPFDR